MTLEAIKKRMLEIMQASYPVTTYKYYSNAVVEKFQRPCFFTELSIDSSEPASFNTEHFNATFSIEILQDVVDEAKALAIGSTLKAAFGRYFMVPQGEGEKDRAVKVKGYDFDFVGTDNNIPTISVMIEWYDRVEQSETADLMGSLGVSMTVRTED